MARRHLEPHEWGRAFRRLLEERGVKTGRGPKPKNGISATVAEIAEGELGVPERTARHRLKLADQYDALPKSAKPTAPSPA